jgi:hypothetical protein
MNMLSHKFLPVIDQPRYGRVTMFMNTITVGDERRVRRGLEVVKPMQGDRQPRRQGRTVADLALGVEMHPKGFDN